MKDSTPSLRECSFGIRALLNSYEGFRTVQKQLGREFSTVGLYVRSLACGLVA
jgi:hypothetical protein